MRQEVVAYMYMIDLGKKISNDEAEYSYSCLT